MSKSERYYPSSKGAARLFRRHGGILHASQAVKRGVHPRTLYRMVKDGALERVVRGVYRLADLPRLKEPDLVAVALRVPQGVLCLLSALAYHGITTQVPHEVHLAIKAGARRPKLDHPPCAFFRYSGTSFKGGVEVHRVDGVPIMVYSPEKTVADCFKFRNKMGLDVALEALKLCRAKRRTTAEGFLKYARLCRVDKVMRPYLEALL